VTGGNFIMIFDGSHDVIQLHVLLVAVVMHQPPPSGITRHVSRHPRHHGTADGGWTKRAAHPSIQESVARSRPPTATVATVATAAAAALAATTAGCRFSFPPTTTFATLCLVVLVCKEEEVLWWGGSVDLSPHGFGPAKKHALLLVHAPLLRRQATQKETHVGPEGNAVVRSRDQNRPEFKVSARRFKCIHKPLPVPAPYHFKSTPKKKNSRRRMKQAQR
jgi:hypothetical protein